MEETLEKFLREVDTRRACKSLIKLMECGDTRQKCQMASLGPQKSLWLSDEAGVGGA